MKEPVIPVEVETCVAAEAEAEAKDEDEAPRCAFPLRALPVLPPAVEPVAPLLRLDLDDLADFDEALDRFRFPEEPSSLPPPCSASLA